MTSLLVFYNLYQILSMNCRQFGQITIGIWGLFWQPNQKPISNAKICRSFLRAIAKTGLV